MDKKKIIKAAIAVAVLTISFILWEFFLNASGITIESIVSFNRLESLFEKLFSFNFIAFLVLFPISYSILIALTRVFSKRFLEAIAVISFIASGIVSLLLFSSLNSFLIISFFYLISLIVVIEIAFIKFDELNSFVMLRTNLESISEGLLVVGIGIFVSTALVAIPIQEKLVQDFEKAIFSSLTPEEIRDEFAQANAQTIVQTQSETLRQITATPGYQAVSQKQDSDQDIKNLVNEINQLSQTFKSPAYKETVNELEAQQSDLTERKDFEEIISQVKKKVPAFSIIEEFFWVIVTVTIISIFFFVSNIVFKPLGAIFGLVFGTLAENFKEKKEDQVQEV